MPPDTLKGLLCCVFRTPTNFDDAYRELVVRVVGLVGYGWRPSEADCRTYFFELVAKKRIAVSGVRWKITPRGEAWLQEMADNEGNGN